MTLTEATRQINAILAALETDTGEHVEGINLKNIEITGIDSVRPELQRSVVIKLKPIPGSHWNT